MKKNKETDFGDANTSAKDLKSKFQNPKSGGSRTQIELDLPASGMPSGSVECLGMEFPDEDARREYFLEKLAEKLKDPEFRKIEGFPIGEDEDILALSDPPYYTVCPNPFLQDFVNHFGKPFNAKEKYHREPFSADVKEGKNHPIYNAHSYHTKVPHQAIMRYILHYTEPGDIIYDGFCGTGMTGVAAQLCNHKSSIQALGYRVQEDGKILKYESDDYGKMSWNSFSKIGSRNTILNDLSPAATFIAHNYNYPINLFEYKIKTESMLSELDKEYAWMFQTLHISGKIKGHINYTVWSDVYICPECAGEVIFWEGAVEVKKDKVVVKKDFPCPHCNIILSKSPLKKSSAQKLERAWITYFDKAIGKPIRQAKQVPVLINYSVGKTRFEKIPDSYDLSVIEKINNMENPFWYPNEELPKGDKTGEPIRFGITNVHHFYTKRTLLVLSAFLNKINYSFMHQQNFLHGSVLPKLTKMNRYMPQHGSRALVGPMANTLYIPPMSVENNTLSQYRFQFKKILKALNEIGGNIVSTQASESTSIPNESVDYLFLDPPFGSNIMYSELSFIREAWLKVFTNNELEAIQNNTQEKGLNEYRHLITVCLEDAFRILKPGRWLTVEFSNTKASVWNAIQTAIQEAGFVVASVDGLDKTRGGFHSMITSTAVKQDLVISAYKPNGGLEKRFTQAEHTEESLWLFVRNHLKHLPKVKIKGAHLEFINERDARILYDRTVAFYIRHNLPVPISSHEFRKGLVDKFPERDGMFFLSNQAAEYDKKRLQVQSLGQMVIWVED